MDEIDQIKSEIKTMQIIMGRLEKRIIALETPPKKAVKKVKKAEPKTE